MQPRVAVCIVTHNSEADLPGCLESVRGLDYDPLEVVIVDCASGDQSPQLAGEFSSERIASRTVALRENRGFAGGMNAAIEQTDAPFILSLNPDARPRPDFLSRLVGTFTRLREHRIGALTGRLLRPGDGPEKTIDAAGMHLTLTWRHFDHNSGEIDHGQRPDTERVFGATGAASLFWRQALEDAALDGEIFASEFHSYREDAELCFRLRERGWEVIYEPTAIAVHSRTNLPERRRQMSVAINYHSLKNRYLLRIYHQSASNLLMTFLPAISRDLAIAAYVLVRERNSLASYRWLWNKRRWLLARRRLVQQRRLISARDLNQWFFRRRRPL